jgi:hypothetical protein
VYGGCPARPPALKDTRQEGLCKDIELREGRGPGLHLRLQRGEESMTEERMAGAIGDSV